MPRPKKHKIDTEQLEKLAAYGCTNIEIASFFNCSESLIRKSYSEYLTKGRDKGKMRLRQMQWKAADRGNVTMLIWLGKQVLGQSEHPDMTEDQLVEGFDLEKL
tara:strand:- start:397 stop:708 length:312 start_codon:yes stop_codon:yes gene_type:complete